ncbi:hypothetical protein PAXRUDRAFT_147912, partial [Paxillus rubicundulus Ve08.2h10]
FSITINKSQGQSVKYVGLDLCIPVFSHGQLLWLSPGVPIPDMSRLLFQENRMIPRQ